MRWNANFHFFISVFILTLLTPGHALADENCIQTGTAQTIDSTTDISDIVDALSGRIEDKKRLHAIYRKWAFSEDISPDAQALQGRARIALAGLMISEGKTDGARKILLTFPQTSREAPRAGLLVASTWLRDGNPDQWINWSYRVANTFPHDPVSQKALLDVSQYLIDEKHYARATTLQNEIEQRYSQTLHALDNDVTFSWLFDSSEKKVASENLKQQVFHRFIRYEPNIISTRQEETALRSNLKCLSSEYERLDEQRNLLRHQLAHQKQIIREIEILESTLSSDVATLEQTLIPNDFSENQLVLRSNLRSTRNQLREITARKHYMQQAYQALPTILAETDRQLLSLLNKHRHNLQALEQNHRAVLDKALADIRQEWHEVMALTEQQRGDMIRLKQQP